MTPLRPRLNLKQHRLSDTLRPSLNFGDLVSPSHYLLLSISSFIHSFLYNHCVLTSKASQRAKDHPTAARSATAKADTTATSGHVNGHNDSNRLRRLATTATTDTVGSLTRRQRDSGDERTRQRRQRQQATPTTSTATKQR